MDIRFRDDRRATRLVLNLVHKFFACDHGHCPVKDSYFSKMTSHIKSGVEMSQDAIDKCRPHIPSFCRSKE